MGSWLVTELLDGETPCEVECDDEEIEIPFRMPLWRGSVPADRDGAYRMTGNFRGH